MIDTFYLGAYWQGRNESLKEVVIKTTRTFQKIAGLDDQFSNWYQLGMSRKAALSKKVDPTSEMVERLYLKNLKKDKIDENGYSEHGYNLGLWSGHSNDESSSISFRVGQNSKFVGNCCVITFPDEGKARDRLLNLTMIKSLINILVDNWNPDGVVLISQKLKDSLGAINEVGWVTFIREMPKMPGINNKVIHEHFNNGHLFYLDSPTVWDYDLAKELLPIKEVSNI